MKKTIRDYNLKNKRVIIRCDFNVEIENGIILDDTKIRNSMKTIEYAINKNAIVILMSHLGKIKKQSDKIKNTLFPVAKKIEELLGKKILFSSDTKSDELINMVEFLKEGDVILIENTRYEDLNNNAESSCNKELSKYWASLGDIFINDAYGTCHRSHASNVGIAKLLPNGIGFLVEEELKKINAIINDDTHPFAVIMGGKKVSDKTLIIDNLITKCDKLIIGGAMAFTFLKALGYEIGKSIVDEENLAFCKSIIEKYKDKLLLPLDFFVTKEIKDNIIIENKKIEEFELDDIGVDIGSETILLFNTYLKTAKRAIVNGPMGIFEIKELSRGTKEIYQCLIDNNVKTLTGGGETLASVNKLGFRDKFYHISTGGGATLEYLGGKELPGIKVIENEK